MSTTPRVSRLLPQTSIPEKTPASRCCQRSKSMHRIFTGNCLSVLPTLRPHEIQMVCTSLPFFRLRDYGTAHWVGGDPACDHAMIPDAGATTARRGRTYQQGHIHRSCRCGAKRTDEQIG